MDSEEQLSEAGDRFGENYFKEVYGVDGLTRFSVNWWSVRWYASMTRRCMREIGGRRLLEIGCGHGFLLSRLENEFDTTGIDISKYAIEQTARFAPKSKCSVANIEDGSPPPPSRGKVLT